jgi:cysteinyl-tRNA synthetase
MLIKRLTDINTPEALATLFSLIHDIEPSIYSLSSSDAKIIANHITEHLNLLGFVDIPKQYKISFRVRSLLKKREETRTNQQFTPADTLRNKVETLGYIIEDTPLGPFAIHHDKTS